MAVLPNYQRLIVWQRAFDLSIKIYEVTKKFPQEELFGLTSQIRRSAVSISSNIAEGAGRKSRLDFKRFLSIALGSVNELENQVLIAEAVKFISEKEKNELVLVCNEIQKMLSSLRSKP